MAADRPALRVHEQDWGELTAHVFARTSAPLLAERLVYERNETTVAARVLVAHSLQGVNVTITDASHARTWCVRVHLPAAAATAESRIDGRSVAPASLPDLAEAEFPLFAGCDQPAPALRAVVQHRMRPGQTLAVTWK